MGWQQPIIETIRPIDKSKINIDEIYIDADTNPPYSPFNL